MAAFQDWTTNELASADSTTEQPDLYDKPAQTPPADPASTGSAIRVSHLHALRDKLIRLAEVIGFDDFSPAGSLRDVAPSADEKDALVGTDGTPSAANPFVTDSDSRLGISGVQLSLLKGLLLYYPFDERINGYRDLVSGIHVGSAVAGVSADPTSPLGTGVGMVGTAVIDALYDPLRVIRPDGDESFTFACWVKITADSFGVIVGAYDFNASNRLYTLAYDDSDDTLVMTVYPDGATAYRAKTAAISLDTWYHVIGWYDADTDEVGVSLDADTPVTTALAGGPKSSSTVPLVIAATANSSANLNGSIAQLVCWRRVLTSDERAEIYNGGSGYAFLGL